MVVIDPPNGAELTDQSIAARVEKLRVGLRITLR